MSRLTNEERLVALETKLDMVIEQLKSLDAKVGNINREAMSPIKHNDDIAALNAAIGRNEERIKRMESSWWIRGFMAALFGSVITFLAMHFFNNLGG